MNYNQATLYAATGKDLIKVPTQVSDWMQKPAMRAINIGWNFANSLYGKAAQMGTINDVVNE